LISENPAELRCAPTRVHDKK